MVFTSSRRLQGRKDSFKYKKRRCITVNLHLNSSKANNSNTSNSDDVIRNSNLPRINVNNKTLLEKLISLQKETDTKSSTIINDEITNDNNAKEEISCHQNPEEVFQHACDNNGNNFLNIKEEVYVVYIHSINATNNISINEYDNFIHKYFAQF